MVRRRLIAAVCSAAAAVLLSACDSGTPTSTAPTLPPLRSPEIATPTEPPIPVPTTANLLSVGQTIFPKILATGGYGICGITSPDASECPITERLRHRLASARITLGWGGQNPSPSRQLSAEVIGNGGVTHVVLFGGRTHIDLVILFDSGLWRVDDEVCASATVPVSIYVATSC
ncbi:MAG: hypothetical protein E6J14_07710 [Chloroflexi bacterium]|nr:MAG: hypothetical protein E6J14_07710 [Chloroflexota bacterium]